MRPAPSDGLTPHKVLGRFGATCWRSWLDLLSLRYFRGFRSGSFDIWRRPMSGKPSQYDLGLDKTPANYVPLTPLSFIARSAAVYPDHLSPLYEGSSFTWA